MPPPTIQWVAGDTTVMENNVERLVTTKKIKRVTMADLANDTKLVFMAKSDKCLVLRSGKHI